MARILQCLPTLLKWRSQPSPLGPSSSVSGSSFKHFLKQAELLGPMLSIGLVNQAGTVPQALSSLGKKAEPQLRDRVEIWTRRENGVWGVGDSFM